MVTVTFQDGGQLLIIRIYTLQVKRNSCNRKKNILEELYRNYQISIYYISIIPIIFCGIFMQDTRVDTMQFSYLAFSSLSAASCCCFSISVLKYNVLKLEQTKNCTHMKKWVK